MGQGVNVLFNFISLIFLALAAVVVVMVIGIAADSIDPPFLAPDPTDIPPTSVLEVGLPTPMFVPTFTPSNTPEVIPTTAETPTSPVVIVTEMPTQESFTAPSIEDMSGLAPITSTPPAESQQGPTTTQTFVPSATGPSGTPTGTLSAYPFVLQQGNPIMRDNFANAAGCNWQGLAGQIVNDVGDPVPGVQVRVRGDTITELTTMSGTNTFYGQSGWEVRLSTQPSTDRYQVDLWYNNVQASPTVEIVFTGACEGNLALINFVLTRPL